jgi:predicted phage terminase large subunit-like protein
MLLCPPQHGKSTIASKRAPAMVLGINPLTDVISASATSPLAEEFGRDVRNCIASSEYRALFPDTQLAEDSQARGRWNTKQGGGYYAVGIGGALMGRGGNLGIIDDPFATWDDAQSETTRNKVWEWYTGTFYNRMRPGAPIIVIQHRMHEDDLVGRLIDKQQHGGDRWEIVELPALLDDPPWVERYDRTALERIRDNSDPRKWSALYQQNPTPEEGTFFQRAWFRRYDPSAIPAGHRYTTADYAVSEGGGDYSEVATHVYAPNGDIYLALEGWRGQTSPDTWIDKTIDQFARWKPLCFYGEKGVIQKATEPFLTRRMRERGKFCRLEWLTRNRDKPAMARPLQAMAAMGKILLPDNEYGEHLMSQFLAFPGSSHDDAVDMCGLMALAVDQAHPGVVNAKVAEARPKDRYDRLFEGSNEEQSWRV